MRQFTCLNCGYVFDESKGVPSHRIAPNMNAMRISGSGCGWHKNMNNDELTITGIPPETKWEDVPADFTCPSCNADKGMFEQ